MPKRIVDGEALWTSGKLKRVPVKIRTHYANWIPLAEANGVFEVDFDVIKSRVYPILEPGFSTGNVQEVFEQFVQAGLLRVWEEAGKTWAYFVGINKSGRLPVDTHLKRYKHLPPNPPSIPDNPGLSGIAPEGFGSGLVLDRLGIGLEDEDMNIKNSLTDKSREILGVRLSPQDTNWSEIKALVRVYGEDAVVDKFDSWAKTLTIPPNYPLSGFVRIADGLLSGKFSKSCPPEQLASLVNDLVVVCDGRVVFNNNQKQVLAGLLADHSPADIKSAFSEYWGNIENDNWKVAQAGKEFPEVAEQIMSVRARRQAKQKETEDLVRKTYQHELDKVAVELEARMREAEATEALIEDTLPTE